MESVEIISAHVQCSNGMPFSQTVCFPYVVYFIYLFIFNCQKCQKSALKSTKQTNIIRPKIQLSLGFIQPAQRLPWGTVHRTSTIKAKEKCECLSHVTGSPIPPRDPKVRGRDQVLPLADGCHNKRHRVNDSHQTSLMGAGKDEGGQKKRGGV